jgi:hypothetical protein
MQSKIIELRRALRNLMGATVNVHTKKANQAHEAARAAYRNSLNEEERERVVKLAQIQIESAPEGHFLKSVDPITSYDDALRTCGDWLIDILLGADG